MAKGKTRGLTSPPENDLQFGSLTEEPTRASWLSRLGLGLLARFAGGGGAPYYPGYPPGCCRPYYPNGPFCPYEGDPSNFTCQEGEYKAQWTCPQGTAVMGCGECQAEDGSCWTGGPYYCSTWWKLN